MLEEESKILGQVANPEVKELSTMEFLLVVVLPIVSTIILLIMVKQ